MAYPDPTSGYDNYAQWVAQPEGGSKPSARHLTLAVALLGVAAYLVSFGPMLGGGGIDWDVRFAVLAGLVAAFGLLPRQTPTAKVVAALATIGFLDALSRVFVVPEGLQPGWAQWVLLVLNSIQAGAAVGALLNQPSATDEQQAWYAAYAEQYAQAAAQYYGQYAQEAEPETVPETGFATAAATATGYAQQPHQEPANYAEFIGDPAVAQPGQPSGPQAAQPSAGLPNVGHNQVAPAQQQTLASEPEYRSSN